MIRLSALSGAAYAAVGAAAVLGVAELTTGDARPNAAHATAPESRGDQPAAMGMAATAAAGAPSVAATLEAAPQEPLPLVDHIPGTVQPDGVNWAWWMREAAASEQPLPEDVAPVFQFARDHQGLRWDLVREAYIESPTSLVLQAAGGRELLADYIEGDWFLNYVEAHAPGSRVPAPGEEGYRNSRDVWFR